MSDVVGHRRKPKRDDSVQPERPTDLELDTVYWLARGHWECRFCGKPFEQ